MSINIFIYFPISILYFYLFSFMFYYLRSTGDVNLIWIYFHPLDRCNKWDFFFLINGKIKFFKKMFLFLIYLSLFLLFEWWDMFIYWINIESVEYLCVFIIYLFIYDIFIVLATSGRWWSRAGAQRTREHGSQAAAGDCSTKTSSWATRSPAGCATRRSGKSQTDIHINKK